MSNADKGAVGLILALELASLTIKFLHLRQNMCLGHSEANNQYAQWLLEIGARSTIDDNEIIQVSQSMVCANLNALINRIYPGIGNSRAQDVMTWQNS